MTDLFVPADEFLKLLLRLAVKPKGDGGIDLPDIDAPHLLKVLDEKLFLLRVVSRERPKERKGEREKGRQTTREKFSGVRSKKG